MKSPGIFILRTNSPLFVVLVIEPRALDMVGKYSTAEVFLLLQIFQSILKTLKNMFISNHVATSDCYGFVFVFPMCFVIVAYKLFAF